MRGFGIWIFGLVGSYIVTAYLIGAIAPSATYDGKALAGFIGGFGGASLFAAVKLWLTPAD